MGLGCVYWNQENYQEALNVYKQLVEQIPNSFHGFRAIGMAEEKLSHRQAAVTAYQKALGIKPDDVDTQIELAYAHHYAGKTNEAVRVLKKALTGDSKNARIHYGFGWLHGQAGRYNESAEAYKRAVQLTPKDAHNRYALGWTYSKLGRYAESAREYTEALRLKPDYEDARESLEWVSFRLKAQEPKKSVKENPVKRDSNVGVVTTPYQPTSRNEPRMNQIN